MKRLLPPLLAAALAALLCGCFLLPKEADIPALPLVTPYDGSDFKTAAVTRGDLTLSKSVSCTYQATSQENYSFSVTGQRYGDIYVAVGDEVKAGDLLAEMEAPDMDREIAACQTKAEQLEIQLTEAQGALALALRSQALTGDKTASDARQKGVTYLEAALEIQKSKLAELTAQRDSLRLYAGIDGTVTFIKDVSAGATTVRGERVVTVTDSSTSMFVASTDQPQYFPPRTEVTVLCEGESYRAVARSAESLGIAVSESDSRAILQKVYLALMDAEAPASTNARGNVELLIDSREDVLMINTSAIFTIGGQAMVYVMPEDGSTEPRNVTTGLTAGRYTEIIDGLSEGEMVIIGGAA